MALLIIPGGGYQTNYDTTGYGGGYDGYYDNYYGQQGEGEVASARQMPVASDRRLEIGPRQPRQRNATSRKTKGGEGTDVRTPEDNSVNRYPGGDLNNVRLDKSGYIYYKAAPVYVESTTTPTPPPPESTTTTTTEQDYDWSKYFNKPYTNMVQKVDEVLSTGRQFDLSAGTLGPPYSLTSVIGDYVQKTGRAVQR